MQTIKVDCNIPGGSENTASKQLAFLLDYATYASPELLNNMLASQLSAAEKSPAKIFSPYEAIGAYLKEQNPQIDGDIQVIDIGDEDCHTFTISFTNGKYTLHRNGRQPQVIPLAPLPESCLQIPATRLKDFSRFLDTIYPGGKPIGAIVWEALERHENGDKYFDDLIAVFGHQEWANITINALVAFKTTLLEKAAIDTAKPYAIVGTLSAVLSPVYNQSNETAASAGARYLCCNSSLFYAPCAAPVILEVYCHPNHLKVPVYDANSSSSEYMVPKRLPPLLNDGNITLYRDHQPVDITTANNPGSYITLEICMNGNQHLMVTAGDKTYLL